MSAVVTGKGWHTELRTMGKLIIWVELEKPHKALTSKEITDSSTEDTCQKHFLQGVFQRCSKSILMMIKGQMLMLALMCPLCVQTVRGLCTNLLLLGLLLLLRMLKLVFCA